MVPLICVLIADVHQWPILRDRRAVRASAANDCCPPEFRVERTAPKVLDGLLPDLECGHRRALVRGPGGSPKAAPLGFRSGNSISQLKRLKEVAALIALCGKMATP